MISSRRLLRLGATVLPALLMSAAFCAPASAHVRRAAPSAVRHAPRHVVGRGTSTNWSGYTVDGTGATQVVGTWTEPKVTCGVGESSWSSPWVGIDGDTSKTVEQTGSDSDCVNGTPSYYAWYEMYPKSTIEIAMTVKPGDSLTGEVTFSGSNTFKLTLTDNTTKATFSTTQTSQKAARTSVEWIVEGPSSGKLSDFGTAAFTGDSGTISGDTAGLGALPSPNPITMITKAGVSRAAPSGVSQNGFSVSWQHA
jgi:hypothetical protein